MYLSSSAVKELGGYGADVSEFLPPEIVADFQERTRNIRNHKEALP